METGDKRTRDGRRVMRDSRHETGDKRTIDSRQENKRREECDERQ